MSPIYITRGAIRRGCSGVDITVKSAESWARYFAPHWDMVMGHKQGRVSDEEYESRYLAILKAAPAGAWTWLYTQGLEEGEVKVLCYCPLHKPFCHTEILIRYAIANLPTMFKADSQDEISDSESEL